jgi:hypothetical protein
MALIDLTNFMHSLALYMATAASLAYLATPRDLVRVAVEADPDAGGTPPLNDPYSVVRPYGGPAQGFDPLQRLSVQCKTTGTDPDAVLSRSQLLYGTLLAADGTPLQMKVIAAKKAADNSADTPGSYRLVGVDLLQRPGLIGVDAKGRHESAWNFDVGVFQF